ncbi:TetR/AcrR family transcriptional regulator [Streptomyces sp. NA13]|nr:TetR/AcrR family transcriptional regulator [Streptomyces sp. NA13]
MDDIAAATGLGKGSLYGAFGDKTKLFHRVFDDWCARIVEVAGGPLAGGPDAGGPDAGGPDAEAWTRRSPRARPRP